MELLHFKVPQLMVILILLKCFFKSQILMLTQQHILVEFYPNIYRTALHFACLSNSIETVKALLSHKNTLKTIEDNLFQTPLDLASTDEIIQLFNS